MPLLRYCRCCYSALIRRGAIRQKREALCRASAMRDATLDIFHYADDGQRRRRYA